VPQLCARLHISRRTLQYAFDAETAMSPHAYLRSIRLNGARRALRGGPGAVSSVREAAAAWGFWNLSQFACDYRLQFGERPSETLHRSLRS
jgi:AraC family ethanolamine operon transcriptional activator